MTSTFLVPDFRKPITQCSRRQFRAPILTGVLRAEVQGLRDGSNHKLATLVLVVGLAWAVTGCSIAKSGYSAVRSDQEAWIGHRSEELIESWGEPDAREELGSGYHAYTWIGDDGACRRTFMASEGKITGYSESDC
jgi:hypothetical protein